MNIKVNLDNNYPNASIDFDEQDFEDMCNIIQEDRWWFEDWIVDYIITNIDNFEDDEKRLELYNALKDYYDTESKT